MTLAEHGADVLCATRPMDYEHDFIYAEANIGSRSANLDLTQDKGKADVERLLADAHVVVNNHRGSKLEKLGIDPGQLAQTHPGLVHVSVTCYGSTGPWGQRGGFDMNGSAASGLMSIEGGDGHPKLPPTGMYNDFITGYMGALGATAGLIRQATEGGSWHVTVSLTRSAMWYQTLGLVDPADAGRGEDNSLREPAAYTRRPRSATSTCSLRQSPSATPRPAGPTPSWSRVAPATPSGSARKRRHRVWFVPSRDSCVSPTHITSYGRAWPLVDGEKAFPR